LPFSAGHGINEALHSAQDAILVNLREMNDIQLSDDGTWATIGPGTKVKKIINELWAQGKQTGMSSDHYSCTL
jgi:FAD/FMN-containing dehydrogenase